MWHRRCQARSNATTSTELVLQLTVMSPWHEARAPLCSNAILVQGSHHCPCTRFLLPPPCKDHVTARSDATPVQGSHCHPRTRIALPPRPKDRTGAHLPLAAVPPPTEIPWQCPHLCVAHHCPHAAHGTATPHATFMATILVALPPSAQLAATVGMRGG